MRIHPSPRPYKGGNSARRDFKVKKSTLNGINRHTQREKIEFGGRHGSLSGQIRSLEPLSIRLKLALDGGAWVHVMTTTQKFLQPDVQTDEKISAAHLVDFELGFAGSAVTPSRVTIPSRR